MAETRRLYYEDVHQREFVSRVTECRQQDDGYEILLEESAFYPEGGGQPSDTGSLNGIQVLQVMEKDGSLIHFTKEPVPAGTLAEGRIDWERRFDLMQQHSGEHMVSGLVHKTFGYDNVGFHMGRDVITIDFNGMLTEADLLSVESEVNREIWKDSEIKIYYPSEDELKTLAYRSKKALSGKVRIVEFPGVDICACCGTHVTHTGEIGMVKILSAVKFRTGVRVEMICGGRVLDYLRMLGEQNHSISVALSAKPEETAKAVLRLQEEISDLHARIEQVEKDQFEAEVGRWRGKGKALIFKKNLTPLQIQKLTDAVMKACGGRCGVFSESPDGTFKYAIGKENGDLRDLVRRMNASLNGRGGGKPFFAQGSLSAKEEEIRKFFEAEA